MEIPMSKAAEGAVYRIVRVDGGAEGAPRLRELGFTEGSDIVPVHSAPLGGDPRAYFVKGTVIALRHEDADIMTVERNDTAENDDIIALIGNPNTGKSTVFNALTGMHQHTGNWSGKTVGNAEGSFKINGKTLKIADLPGIYSLVPISEDEKNAVDYIKSGKAAASVIVVDATCLERGLMLALEAAEYAKKAVICLNLIDEAERKNIKIDTDILREKTGLPVIEVCGVSGKGLDELKKCIFETLNDGTQKKVQYERPLEKTVNDIFSAAVSFDGDIMNMRDRKTDRIVMSGKFGLPIIFLVTAFIFWITIAGANYPSAMLQEFFLFLSARLYAALYFMPEWFKGLFISGVFDTMGCVVSVMLPPMAIFFPLFTLLEDLGYLPRMAFCLDRCMRCARAHGKMVLTMCMGLGCNAVGVTSARIIGSPRERLLAILTNSFIPCNGRFPTLILMISLFLAAGSIDAAFILSCCIMLSLAVTIAVSNFLSRTMLKGRASSTMIELPPYRRPKPCSIIVRSILDRTIFVLGRAVVVAAPAGAVIWLLSGIYWGDKNILHYLTLFFEPLGRLMGLDGCILTGFVLGMPANEIVLPIIMMCYRGGGLTDAESAVHIKEILLANGWCTKTAVCTIVFLLCHFPCTTTLLTVKRETGSIKWTIAAFILPTLSGILLCCAVNALWSLF